MNLTEHAERIQKEIRKYKIQGKFNKDILTKIGNKLIFSRKQIKDKYINQYQELEIPCGKCIGCKLDKAEEWAVRCINEKSMHKESCFITLTYAPEHLPKNEELKKRDMQLFWKRLRKETGIKGIKYLECGEYGDEKGRPHYHAALYGWIPKDLKHYKKTKRGDTLYTSATMEKIWGKGFAPIGEITDKSARYISSYTIKRQTKWKKDKNGKKIYEKQNEYVNASRRPGIGEKWARENIEKMIMNNGIWVKDSQKNKAKLRPIPRYYMKLIEKENWEITADMKYKKKQQGIENEEIRQSKTSLTKKEYLRMQEQSLWDKIKTFRAHQRNNYI